MAGARVVLLCRNEGRGEAAVREVCAFVEHATGCPPSGGVEFVLCDVSHPESVRKASAELRKRLPRIDLLFLNAGTMPGDGFAWSVLLESILRFTFLSFLETGRSHPGSPHFLPTPLWAAQPDADKHAGAPHLLAVHVIGHTMLAEACADNGLLAAGRVPRLAAPATEAGELVSPTERDLPAFLRGTPSAGAVRTPACPDIAPVDSGVWLRPDSGSGGGGSRVIWTGSRAAKTTVALSALYPHPGSARGGVVGEEGADAYGEAKQLVDALSPGLEARLRAGPAFAAPEACATSIRALKHAAPAAHGIVVCPGFVATAIVPFFMKLALPFLEVVRPHICGQQLTVRRGIQPHLAAVLADDSSLEPWRKLICHRGMLTVPINGFRPATTAEQSTAMAVVQAWLDVWRPAA